MSRGSGTAVSHITNTSHSKEHPKNSYTAACEEQVMLPGSPRGGHDQQPLDPHIHAHAHMWLVFVWLKT